MGQLLGSQPTNAKSVLRVSARTPGYSAILINVLNY